MGDKKSVVYLQGLGDDGETMRYCLKTKNREVVELLRQHALNNETIKKLADMEGKDVVVHLRKDIMDGKGLMKVLRENMKMLRGVLMASRREEAKEKCQHCRDRSTKRDLIQTCIKVPGMEEIGCASCWCRCWDSWMVVGCMQE